MINKVTRGGGKLFIAVVTMCACICSMVVSNVSVAYAEKIIHTHIWATKYDDKNHWEYCTVCGDIKDKAELDTLINKINQMNIAIDVYRTTQ